MTSPNLEVDPTILPQGYIHSTGDRYANWPITVPYVSPYLVAIDPLRREIVGLQSRLWNVDRLETRMPEAIYVVLYQISPDPDIGGPERLREVQNRIRDIAGNTGVLFPVKDTGLFLDYDLTMDHEPVNQLPLMEGWVDYVPADPVRHIGWRRYVCTFAHQLSLLPSHTTQHMDRDNVHVLPDDPHDDDSNARWKWTWKYGRGVVGLVFVALDTWSKIDPQETDTATGNLLWQERQSQVSFFMRSICDMCPSRYWARLLLAHMDPALWEVALTPIRDDDDSNWEIRLPQVNKETWQPKTGTYEVYTLVQTPHSPNSYWKRWTDGYKRAIIHHDEHYAQQQFHED